MTKILLVEDDKNLREIYGTRLYAEGYDIVSAGDGEEALAMAIKERPALIISDVMMPKISGFDMLDILRSTTETKDIRVIMMTALSSEDQRKRGEALGADRYLVKSQVGIEDVVRTVHEVLADAPGAAGQAQVATSAAPAPLTPGIGTSTPPSAAPISAPSLSIPSRPTAAAPVVAPMPMPTPAATIPQPAATPQPITPPTPQPVVAPGPTAAPAPAPAAATPPTAPAQPVELPQPTAPFSTPRPANLGDRVIQPIVNDGASELDSIADRMRNELSGLASPVPAPDEPTSLPTNTVPVAPLPPMPDVTIPPIPASAAPASTAPTPAPIDLSFEETPRQTPPNA